MALHMAHKFSSLIEAYCKAHGVAVPDGFHRRAASRYVVILLGSSPPMLVARTWFKPADVVHYLKQYVQPGDGVGVVATPLPVRILDFKDMMELSYMGGARLRSIGPMSGAVQQGEEADARRSDPDCRPHMLSLSDFSIQPRGSRTFDVWSHAIGFATPMGRFDVDCVVDIAAKPTVEMLGELEPLLAFVLEHNHDLLLAIHEHYLLACRDTAWMRELQLPIGLGAEQIVPLLRFRAVSVAHMAGAEIGTDARRPCIHIVPAWDEEHALFFAVHDGIAVRLVQ